MAEDGIHRRKPTEKLCLSEKQKLARLAFCLQYRYLDWREVIFTDESYFETGALRRRRAKGVLRRAGEAYLPRNINRKFASGATVMFWGAILYGHSGITPYILIILITNNYLGAELPYHTYKTPYETPKERKTADQQLAWEYQLELQQDPETAELKTRKIDRKGGIDWFIYRERILNPLLYPFAVSKTHQRPGVLIMEDNAPSHIHRYHDLPREKLGLKKLIWPSNSPDLNPIETIWNEMKDQIKAKIGFKFTAIMIRELVVNVWKNYPVERINHHIMSMSRRIEACIANNGGNSYNF